MLRIEYQYIVISIYGELLCEIAVFVVDDMNVKKNSGRTKYRENNISRKLQKKIKKFFKKWLTLHTKYCILTNVADSETQNSVKRVLLWLSR